jgi:hypothetical protein
LITWDDKFEDYYLLEYDAVWPCRCLEHICCRHLQHISPKRR